MSECMIGNTQIGECQWRSQSGNAAEWGCLDCKRVLADAMAAQLAPIRERARELEATPGRVDEILVSGAERARMIARETLREARDLMGFLPVPGHHD